MADLQPLNLTNLTAEQAVKALVSGATLRLADGNDLSLTDEDARKALRFFLKDAAGKRLWISPPRAGSTEIATALFKWLDAPHQNEVVSAKGDDGVGPLWRVTRLSISNFGGLHPFWSGDGAAPPVLDIDFERDVTLIEGGKVDARLIALAADANAMLEPEAAASQGRHPLRADLLVWHGSGVSETFECGATDGRSILTQLMHGQVRVTVLPFAGLGLPTIRGYAFRLTENPAQSHLTIPDGQRAWDQMLASLPNINAPTMRI